MQAAAEAGRAGEGTRDLAERFIADTSGRFAGAMYQGYLNDSEIDFAKERFLTEASHAGQKVADEVLAAKSHLDHLDWQAHKTIEEMSKAGPFSEGAKWAIIGQASAAAAAYVAGAAAQIAAQAAKITGAVNIPHKSGGPPNGTPGKPFHESPKIDRPGEVKPMGNEHGKEGRGDKRPQEGSNPSDSGTDKGDKNSAAGDRTGSEAPATRAEKKGVGEGGTKQPSLGNAAGASPFSGGSPSGSGGSGSGSPAGGLGSGLMGGNNPAQALQSGLKGAGSGGGSPASSMGGGSGLGKGLSGPGSGAGSAGQVNPMRDFARGFSSGGAPAATPLAQPASHAAPAPAPSAPPVTPAPAAGTSAPASPLSGVSGPPPAAPPSAASPGAAVGGGAGPNPAGLAPVGSDMARHAGAASAGPAVSTAAGHSGAAGSIAGGAATASMGAGILAAAQGTSSRRGGSEPQDPLLADAVRLVFQLMHASRFYPGIDWCVAVFRTEGVVETVVTSNEGAGYVPAGVFLPRSVRPLFSDPLVTSDFHDQWFGYTDPVATMMAYAEIRRGESYVQPVHALAASSMMGGALAVAEVAGVEHLHLCLQADSPFSPADGDQVLDDMHVHRLGLTDPDLLAWMHSNDRTLSEVTARADGLSTKAFHAVSARLGTSQITIPDVGAAVYNQLTNSEIVDENRWEQLFLAMQLAQGAAGAVRPGADSLIGSDVYHCRHDVVRLLEMLYWWRPAGGEDAAGESICFTEIAYCARQIVEGDQ